MKTKAHNNNNYFINTMACAVDNKLVDDIEKSCRELCVLSGIKITFCSHLLVDKFMKALADVKTPELSLLFNRIYNCRNIEYINPYSLESQHTDIWRAKGRITKSSFEFPMVKYNAEYFVKHKKTPLTTEQQYWNTHIVPKIDYFYELELALKLLLYIQCEIQCDTSAIPLKNVNNFMDHSNSIYVSDLNLQILCKIFNVVFTENYCDTVRALVTVLFNAQKLDKTVCRKIYELYTAYDCNDINLKQYIFLHADELIIQAPNCYKNTFF